MSSVPSMKKRKPNVVGAAQDIIQLKITAKDTLGGLKRKFYGIMRKRGVCKGQRMADGSIMCDNFEWTTLHTLFVDRIREFQVFENLFEKMPPDIEAYPCRKKKTTS